LAPISPKLWQRIINSDRAPCATNLIQPTSGSGETKDLLNGAAAHGSYKNTNRQTTTMPIYNIRYRVLPIVFPAFCDTLLLDEAANQERLSSAAREMIHCGLRAFAAVI